MKVLVVGAGGREHAIVRALARAHRMGPSCCARPATPGIAQDARLLDIAADDVEGIVAAVEREGVDFTVVGPEAAARGGARGRARRPRAPRPSGRRPPRRAWRAQRRSPSRRWSRPACPPRAGARSTRWPPASGGERPAAVAELGHSRRGGRDQGRRPGGRQGGDRGRRRPPGPSRAGRDLRGRSRFPAPAAARARSSRSA